MDLPLWARLCVGIGLAAALAYLATPLAIGAARRLAFYDLPTGYKGHSKPTPYLGGAAVMSAFALALLIGAGHLSRTLPVLAGVGILFALGTVDDRRTVPPSWRVAIELGLGALLAAEGRGWRLGTAGWIDAVITGIWVVAVVNAFNLFDNMDGAAGSIGAAVAAGACALALITGQGWVAAGSGALCGACLGFLPHNLCSPAKVFLGDGGSLPLGFAVAVVVLGAARGAEPGSLALLVGLLLVGIPALDTALVIVSRMRRRVSILTGGQDHLTHRIRRRWRTTRRVALVLSCAQLGLTGLAILAAQTGSATLVYVTLAFITFAAAAIVALEDDVTMAGATSGAASGASRRQVIATVGLGAIGVASGLSPLFSAYYDPTRWVPIGLALVILAAIGVVARPIRFTAPVTLALIGLSGLALWSLLSMSWAAAVELANAQANLWLCYAALFVLLMVLISRRWHGCVLLAAVGGGILTVALTVIVRMLGHDAGTLFIGGRLNSPLGYVNGEGCMFAMGCWFSLALAERRVGVMAAVGMAATVAMACLALLSESRGTAIAIVAAALVTVIVVPGWRRRVLALAVVVGAVATVSSPLLAVYRAGGSGSLPAATVHGAAISIVLAAVVTGVAWGLLVALANRIAAGGQTSREGLRRCSGLAARALLAAPVLAAVIWHAPLEQRLQTQWRAFTHPSTLAVTDRGQVRLLSGAGDRYDYWRVAWRVFLDHPVAGVGAGNYPASYYQRRRTQEAVQNPHSIELQTLAELGLVGAILLVITFAGVVVGARRLRIVARTSDTARTTMLAATGVSVVWLVETSVDWMHLLPGVTAAALCGFAVLCRAQAGYAAVDHRPGSGRRASVLPIATAGAGLPALAGAAAVIFVLGVGGASLLRGGLAQRHLHEAQAALAADPAAAIADARQALALDGEDLDAYYVEAAGQARFDQAAAARATLLQAAAHDRTDLVTWTLLGDLEARAGNPSTARSYYRRALGLDPLDSSIRHLVADPGAVDRSR